MKAGDSAQFPCVIRALPRHKHQNNKWNNTMVMSYDRDNNTGLASLRATGKRPLFKQ